MSGFRLGTLLRLRSIQEDQAAAELSRAHTAVAVQDRRAERELEVLSHVSGPSSLAAAGFARAAAANQLAEIAATKSLRQGEVTVAEAALVTARTSHRVAQKLKERHDLIQSQGFARAERLALDEATTAATHRTRSTT